MKSLSSLLFEKVHSSNLIYNCCWEDPRVDRKVLNLNSSSCVLVITSAGCNALDYMLAGAGTIHAVDMNYRQNALLELKIAAARGLDYADYFSMFGYGVLQNPTQIYKENLRSFLTSASQKYWDKYIQFFKQTGLRNSFYFHGTSGLVARCMKLYLDHVAGAGQICKELLEASDLEEQKSIYFGKLKPKLWNSTLRWIINSTFFMALLGVPKAQIEQVQRYHPRGMSGFIEDCLDNVFGRLSLKDNYFWRVYLQGHYDLDCCPEYLTESGYNTIREGGFERINIHTSTIKNFLKTQNTRTFSHFVLLDHMDWLHTNLKEELSAEWEEILRVADLDSKVIFRSGGYKVEYLDDLEVKDKVGTIKLGSKLKYDTNITKELHPFDRVHTYGSFYLAEIAV